MIKKTFPFLAISVFSTMLGLGIIAPLLPLYADSLGATGLWIGVIFGGFSVSRAVFTPLFGRLSDSRGRKNFLGTGLFIYSVLSLGYIFSGSVFELLGVRLIHGAVSGMIIPIARAWVGEMAPEGEEGKWMGYFNSAFFIGTGCGPLLGGMLGDYLGMAQAFAAMGVLNFIAFLAVALMVPSDSKRKREAGAGIRVAISEMTGSSMFKALFFQRLMSEISASTLFVFLPVYAGVNLELSAMLIGILIAVSLLTFSLLQLWTGILADRFDRKIIVVLANTFSCIFLAAIPFAGNFRLLFLLIVFRSLGTAFSLPATSALSIQEGRKFGMGSTVGALSVATSIGMGIGPIAGGAVADILSVQSVFLFSAGTGFAGVALFGWYSRKQNDLD